MQSYILTNYRLRKKEPLIALGSHQGGRWEHFISACAVPHYGIKDMNFLFLYRQLYTRYIMTYYRHRKKEPLIALGWRGGGGT